MSSKKVKATLALTGTTIGAGMFAMPYVTAKVGLPLGLIYLIGLGYLTLLINLAYGEIILRTKGDHQFPGYAQKYLGPNAKHFACLLMIFSLYGPMLAYLVKIGEFLALLFPHFFTPQSGALVFFTLGAWTIFFGLKTISVVESYLTLALIGLIGVIGVISLPKIEMLNWIANPNFSQLFLPYGVFLFALAGSTVIPEMEEIQRAEPKNLKTSIVWGTLIPVLAYTLFIAAVVGVSGPLTSDDAIKGLVGFLSPKIISLGAVVGLLAMATSFLTIGYVLKEFFYRDFKINQHLAWGLACLVPLILYLGGATAFIPILSLTGAVAIGLQNALTMIIYTIAQRQGEKKPAYTLNLKMISVAAIVTFFLGGVIMEVIASVLSLIHI